jgi:hypothetical protein
MIRLLSLRHQNLRPVLPTGPSTEAWHQALAAAIGSHLSPAHAALLAQPTAEGGNIVWFAPGSALRRFSDLSEDDRHKLQAAAHTILSDIRRLAESVIVPALTEAWPAMRVVPDIGCLFAVDGRPVLAAWGFAPKANGPGPLAALDDGVPGHRRLTTPWPVYAATLATLGALALLVGLALPAAGSLLRPVEPVCHVGPGQLALLQETTRQADRAAALKEELAQLQENRGELTLQCPIPREFQSPSPRPAPPAPTRQQAQACVGRWPIGSWIHVTDTPKGLIPELGVLPADPAVSLPRWSHFFTRSTPCGAFHQRRSISTRPGRLPDGRSVILNSIIADGPDGSQICYEYWDAYRKDGDRWVRDAAKLEAVVLRTPAGTATDGTPTDYCTPLAPTQR